MNFSFKGRSIPVFNLFGLKGAYNEEDDFYNGVKEFIIKSDDYGYAGILLPESNSAILNPWFFANQIFHLSEHLIPFIAINPVYTHPFFVAKYIFNMSFFSKRPMYLNYITGTALFDSPNLGDTQKHNSKYDRLQEYIQIVNGLLEEPKPLNYHGQFYDIQNLSLPQTLHKNARPHSYVAGSSASSLSVIKTTASSRLSMAMSLADFAVLNENRTYDLGFHLGIISRESDEEAADVLLSFCPDDKLKKSIQYMSTVKSKIIWKKELLEKSVQLTDDDVYNLIPFTNGYSDVPYLVGNYVNVARYIYEYLNLGLGLLVIEIPVTGFDEFYFISRVFNCLKDMTDGKL
jgi:alkanesulfonate monooxygenase